MSKHHLVRLVAGGYHRLPHLPSGFSLFYDVARDVTPTVISRFVKRHGAAVARDTFYLEVPDRTGLVCRVDNLKLFFCFYYSNKMRIILFLKKKNYLIISVFFSIFYNNKNNNKKNKNKIK